MTEDKEPPKGATGGATNDWPACDDPPSGKLLSQVQQHSQIFVGDLIQFGRDQIVMVRVEVEFGNGTSLKYERDDFANSIFIDSDEDDDE